MWYYLSFNILKKRYLCYDIIKEDKVKVGMYIYYIVIYVFGKRFIIKN